MTVEHVKHIIGRAVVDADFREQLFTDLDAAVEDYELTTDERDALTRLEREKFEELSSDLGDRISRAGIGFGSALGGHQSPSESNMGAFDRILRNAGLRIDPGDQHVLVMR